MVILDIFKLINACLIFVFICCSCANNAYVSSGGYVDDEIDQGIVDVEYRKYAEAKLRLETLIEKEGHQLTEEQESYIYCILGYVYFQMGHNKDALNNYMLVLSKTYNPLSDEVGPTSYSKINPFPFLNITNIELFADILKSFSQLYFADEKISPLVLVAGSITNCTESAGCALKKGDFVEITFDILLDGGTTNVKVLSNAKYIDLAYFQSLGLLRVYSPPLVAGKSDRVEGVKLKIECTESKCVF